MIYLNGCLVKQMNRMLTRSDLIRISTSSRRITGIIGVRLVSCSTTATASATTVSRLIAVWFKIGGVSVRFLALIRVLVLVMILDRLGFLIARS